MNNTKIRLLLLFLVVLLASFLFFSAFNNGFKQSDLSAQQVSNRVEQLYAGDIQSVTKTAGQFIVSFKKETSIYEISVDEQTGEFSNLQLVYALPVEAEPFVNSDKNETIPPATAQLSEQHVIAIAQQQLTGELEEIKFVATADGGYYLVEIDSHEEEATFQIHAVTGNVLSVSFDD